MSFIHAVGKYRKYSGTTILKLYKERKATE